MVIPRIVTEVDSWIVWLQNLMFFSLGFLRLVDISRKVVLPGLKVTFHWVAQLVNLDRSLLIVVTAWLGFLKGSSIVVSSANW